MSVNKASAGTSKQARSQAGSSSASTSSSLFGLKAELERAKAAPVGKNAESSKRKHGVPAQDASLSYWDKRVKNKQLPSEPNRKAADRSERTKKRHKGDDDAAPTQAQLDAIRRNMERKAKIYAQLEAGKYAGMDDEQLAESSIDWQRKALEATASVPDSPPSGPRSDDADAEVEYVDEFGRTRTANLSDVPREFLSTVPGYRPPAADDDNVIYGPATSFPVYTPTLRQPAKPVVGHFDPNAEKRHLGAASYKFSRDEATRSRQMDELSQLRQQTLHARASSTQTPHD